ncbi:MAG: MATE family efflux transporter [Clostridiaceae bacterium]|nr:MATE family efflux transporter [Clostridiaceae bacterium]
MKYSISKHFTTKDILLFTLPSILTMIFTSLYTIVDGIFVSRFVGSDALSAINIVLPVINLTNGIGIMMGTGGSAVIGRKLGEGNIKGAQKSFSLIIAFTFGWGLICTVLLVAFSREISLLLGSSERLIEECTKYLRVYSIFLWASILQIIFQTLLVTAGKPNLSLFLTLAAGISNIVLDFIFIVPMNLGIIGAALGTGISCLVASVPSFLFFYRNKGDLHFARFRYEPQTIFQTLSNGSSEMVSSVASGIIVFLFNKSMMALAGEDGVAALSVVMYTQFLFAALHIGFSNGIAPVFSYHYGSGNKEELRGLFKKCFFLVISSTVFVVVTAFVTAEFVVAVFTGRGNTLYELTLHGYRIFIWNFLFAGINIFASALFTALSNGLISASISFLRTFIAEILAILFLPVLLGINGLWLAVPSAEFISSLFAVFCIIKYFVFVYFRKKQQSF